MSTKSYTMLIPITRLSEVPGGSHNDHTNITKSHLMQIFSALSKLKYVVFIHLFSVGRAVSSFFEGLSIPQKTWVLTEDQ